MAWAKTIAALAVAVPFAVADGQTDINSIIEGVSVITLAIDADTGDTEQGSGAIVDGPNGLVLCTFHQVKGPSDIKVITDAPREEHSAKLLLKDEEHDLAILKTDNPLGKSALIGNADTLSELADIVAVTTPGGIEFQKTKGIVSAVDETFNGKPVFTVNMTGQAGSSGGPIFNMLGKVVGIASRDFVGQPGLFIAARINSAYPLLEETEIPIPSLEPSNEQIIPSSNATAGGLAAVHHFNRGLQSESNEVKVEQYGLAVERSEDFFEAWFNYAIALKEAQQYEQAAGAYEQARQLRPESPPVYRNLGLLYLNPPFNDNRSAEEMFRKLVNYRRRDPASHNFLGESCRRQHKLEAAEASFKYALHLDPDYAKAHYNLAITYLEMRKLDRAKESFERYQKHYPDKAEKREFQEMLSELTR